MEAWQGPRPGRWGDGFRAGSWPLVGTDTPVEPAGGAGRPGILLGASGLV